MLWAARGVFSARSFPLSENKRAIGAAETERIGQRNMDLCLLRLVGNVVQPAFRIGVFEVDGWRSNLFQQGLDGNACFQSASSAEQVPGHGFGGADEQLAAGGVLAEEILQCRAFEYVSHRSGSGVGVDVIHLMRLDMGAVQRVLHGTVAALAFRGHAGDVVGIGAHAVADNFGKYLRSARFGELQVLQNEDASAFADNKTIAVFVKGTAGTLRLIIARGKGAHRGESADAHGSNGGFCSAGDHHVSIAALNNAIGITDGVRAGGAGSRGGLIGASGAVFNADLAGGEVDDRRRNEERRYLARTALQHGAVLALDNVEPADAGTNVDTDTVGNRIGDLQAGHLHGLMRGSKSKVDEARHFLRFLLVHKIQRIEVLHLGSEGERKSCRIEAGDGGHPALACKQIVPDLRRCVAYAAQQPNARDYDAPLQGYLPPFAFFSM